MHTSKRFIGILLVAFLFSLVVLLLRGNEDGWRSESRSSEEYAGKNEKETPMLEVRGFTSYAIGGLVCGEGKVKNVSGEKLGYVRSIFTFYERDGSVFDFSEGYVNSKRTLLLPDEEALFKRCVEDKDFQADTKKTKFQFRGKIGDAYDDKVLGFEMK
jgi:hypothetical protein